MPGFDDIRPYRDDEVRDVLARVIADDEFLSALARFRFSGWPAGVLSLLKPVIRWALRRKVATISDVRGFQDVVAGYMEHMMKSTTTALTVSGLESLDPQQTYLFISNHRDIAMDPAFINWVLHSNQRDTLRIAIGDNLLTKPFASDLMRLNKSFLVRRGETAPKKIFAALKNLSAYIYHSLTVEHASIWIAQMEGRAKDGLDRTEVAILKMFAMSKPKEQPFADFVRTLNIVPVSISYEWDPCDVAKARELYCKEVQGSYQKDTHEDVQSIALGITGHKGCVHVSFGQALRGDYDTPEAVAAEIDRQIIGNYILQPSNFFARLAQDPQADVSGVYGAGKKPFDPAALQAEQQLFSQRLQQCPAEYRPYFLAMYANPLLSRQRLGNG